MHCFGPLPNCSINHTHMWHPTIFCGLTISKLCITALHIDWCTCMHSSMYLPSLGVLVIHAKLCSFLFNQMISVSSSHTARFLSYVVNLISHMTIVYTLYTWISPFSFRLRQWRESCKEWRDNCSLPRNRYWHICFIYCPSQLVYSDFYNLGLCTDPWQRPTNSRQEPIFTACAATGIAKWFWKKTQIFGFVCKWLNQFCAFATFLCSVG